MSVITFSASLPVTNMSWSQQRRDVAYRSPFGSQSVEVGGALWAVSVTAPAMRENTSGAWKALLMQLRGNTNQLELWDMQRESPQGTMRGTMTLNGAHSAGATSLSVVASGENAKTLVQGDLLGLGSGTTQQVVMVTTDATSNGSGVIAVTVNPPLRNAFSSGAAITWDKPKALFRMTKPTSGWNYAPGKVTSGFTLDLLEDWRA